MLARQISDDAAAFNDAYGQAVTGQILLNILRARDRQPRYYLSMSGITDSPSVRYQESLSASSIPLGEGASPWGFGSFGLQRETQSRPSYALQPLNADTLAKTVFQPTPVNVFAHYWSSGWSRDLLIFLMVERITRFETLDGSRVIVEAVNDSNSIRSDCSGVSEQQAGGCAFVTMARALLSEIRAETEARDAADGAPVCGLIAAYAPAQPVRRTLPASGQSCPARLILGATTYVLDLRSFDDIVYYVGELMRPALMDATTDGAMAAPLNVRSAGLRSDVGVPLFRIVPEGAVGDEAPDTRGRFAASVVYGGARYFAGPPVGRACAAATPKGPCTDDAAHGDRSSSVLSLLAELLALNQSPESIRAPQRLLVE